MSVVACTLLYLLSILVFSEGAFLSLSVACTLLDLLSIFVFPVEDLASLLLDLYPFYCSLLDACCPWQYVACPLLDLLPILVFFVRRLLSMSEACPLLDLLSMEVFAVGACYQF